MEEKQFRTLIKTLHEIGLGDSTSKEGFGALELLGMHLEEKLGQIENQLSRIADALEK